MLIGADGLPADIDPRPAISGSGLAPTADPAPPVLPEFSLQATIENAAIMISKNLFEYIRFMFFASWSVPSLDN